MFIISDPPDVVKLTKFGLESRMKRSKVQSQIAHGCDTSVGPTLGQGPTDNPLEVVVGPTSFWSIGGNVGSPVAGR